MIVPSTQQPVREGLSVSIVVYKPDTTQLVTTLLSLRDAIVALGNCDEVPASVYVVDNGGLPDMATTVGELQRSAIVCTTISGQGNVGYGQGHNLAIERASSMYHLVLNPDIDMDSQALAQALEFLDKHPETGLLTPRIGDETGSNQYLCRRYPTLLDLLVRGFLPGSLRGFFATRLARYEMRDQINDQDIVWDPPIVSGCFMLFRTEVLKKLAGFDPRYFLYFEDYDLSLRTHDVARVAYVPSVRIVHHGGGAARKGLTHIRMFAASAYKFFNRFGWKWL